jgi:NADP+-dependent farnesol dehydrogenase
VTGASRGIGAEISLKLADAGCTVIGLARTVDKINELSLNLTNGSPGKIIGRKCDIENEEEVKEAFEWLKTNFQRLDIFVNNAGIMKTTFLIDDNRESFRKIFEVNVIASCVCIKEAVNLMKTTNGQGHIVIMNSILGHRIPDVPSPLRPFFGVYPATKFALTGICQTLRQELSFYQLPIKVTSISPGMVESEMLNNMNSNLVGMLPKLKVEDVAEAVYYAVNTPNHVRIDEIILTPVKS